MLVKCPFCKVEVPILRYPQGEKKMEAAILYGLLMGDRQTRECPKCEKLFSVEIKIRVIVTA